MISGIKDGIINAVIRQGTLLKQFTDYVKRVLADSGLIKDLSATSRYMQMAKSNGMLDSIRFAWLGEAGYKQRTSGINTFWTKIYSLVGTNDATQTTSTNQPYLAGNIAPNEKWCLKNPNGGSNYMTHPTISFAANEAWSVQTVLNFNGDLAGASNPNNSLFGDISNNNTVFGLKHTSNSLIFRNSSGTVKQFTKGINSFNGKTVVLHIVAIGNDTLSVYINGALYETVTTIPTNVIINKLFGYGPSYFGYFKISSHAIYSAALTPSQVAAEANFLRSLYPEIPSVTIGSQVWATSNCEMVATPMGNLIANVTDNAMWADSTNIYNTTYAATSGTDEQKTYAAVKAAAMWCYYNNDAALGAVYGKLYNWYAVKLLQMDIDYYNAANPSAPWGWRVPTDTDFNTLATTLGGASVAGGKTKVAGTTYWNSPNAGADNSSGFSSLPGGRRFTDGTFSQITFTNQIWSISESDASNSKVYFLTSADGILANTIILKLRGASLRLIKN